jgi:hypothetical protein
MPDAKCWNILTVKGDFSQSSIQTTQRGIGGAEKAGFGMAVIFRCATVDARIRLLGRHEL